MPWGGLLSRLKAGLKKTRDKLGEGLRALAGRKLDEDVIDRLEEILYQADIGPKMVARIVEDVREAYHDKLLSESGQLYPYLKEDITRNLRQSESHLVLAPTPPTVILTAGINGSGKTTSIAKLAYRFKQEGKKVLLAASDTFRAAAGEQLEIWAKRAGCDLVKHRMGSDPAAVAYDAAEAALARGADFLIVDTAGRMHTYQNLMRELEKIARVLGKKIPGAPHEVLLVLDATTGQNAISQAKLFSQSVKVTGIFLAKLDGTAKGGIVLAIQQELGIPVKFVGLGETLEDMEPFEPAKFVEALFG
jgi:fused signal recognition particle receptor